jgi:SpoVK/Ycf46/Vps4 family AAA+-type ATPase
MTSETLKRLFRAMNEGSESSLRGVARAIIDDEKRKGHERLAGELDTLLNAPRRADMQEASLRALPASRRKQEPLTSSIPISNLRHHMVLPSRVENRFARIIKEFAARERLAEYGLLPRRKILLHGPPGCGKTLGAERLAWETGLPMVKIRVDSVLSSLFGESASNLRQVFESANEAPCLLFLDECDSIARSRTYLNDVGEVPRIVNTLLILLEEYHAPGLLVAATNLTDSLDSAIFRRFDDAIEIPLPGLEEAERLLRMTLSAVDVDDKLNWTSFAERLFDMSAAQIVRIAQESAKSVVLSQVSHVNLEHLNAALAENQSEL